MVGQIGTEAMSGVAIGNQLHFVYATCLLGIVAGGSVFGEMIRQGIFIEANPAAMAVNFYAPVYFLLNKYDQEWGREDEALAELKQHVEEFGRIYLKKDRDA